MEEETKQDFYSLSREQRGRLLIEQGAKPQMALDNVFLMPSQFTQGRKYKVIENYDKWVCTCPDYQKRHLDCKHILAVKYWLELKGYLQKQGLFKGADKIIPTCFYCSSQKVIKRGVRKNKGVQRQRFYCKDCRRYFVADKEFQGIKVTPEMATLCLDLFFKGLSLRKIKDTLQQFYGQRISHETVRSYISVFMEAIDKQVKGLQPKGCSRLHTDETFIKENGATKYCWNTLDRKSRFLLASTVTESRGKKDAKQHFRQVKDRYLLHPKQITTDGLFSYHDAIRETFNSGQEPVRHERSVGFLKNQRVERLHNSQKERLKVMRGFNGQAGKQMRDWKNYYNFLRPHQGLNGKTPAEKAGIEAGLNGNRWKGLIVCS